MNTELLAKLQVLRQTVEQLNSINRNGPESIIYSSLLQIVNILDELYVERNGGCLFF